MGSLNSLPAGRFRPATESGYGTPDPTCGDPGIQALARTVAQAIREARPVVTLPPHIFIPWRGVPFFAEGRIILDGTAGVMNVGAVEAGGADGVTVVAENAVFRSVASFTVPQGHFAVLREWAAQSDLGGYFQVAGLPVVRSKLVLGTDTTINSPGLLGTKGTLEHPFDVSYVVPERTVVAVQFFSSDAAMWHLVESYIRGHIFATNEVFGDSIGAAIQRGS